MTEQEIRERFSRLAGHLNEQAKRLWCANEALALGWGGITLVAKATGVSRTTITGGIEELLGIRPLPSQGIRRPGGGRKKKSRSAILISLMTCWSSLSRLYEAIRNRHYAGSVRALESSQRC